jgi:hypothetical protein
VNLPSLRLSLANPEPWLLDSSEELLKDKGGRADTSGWSQSSAEGKHHHWVSQMVTGLTICCDVRKFVFWLSSKVPDLSVSPPGGPSRNSLIYPCPIVGHKAPLLPE